MENRLFRDKEINDKNFQLIVVPRDGNCFYSCLSEVFYGNIRANVLLRKLVAKYVKDNYEYYKGMSGEESGESYFLQHAWTEEMAEKAEIQAAADYFQVVIRVKHGEVTHEYRIEGAPKMYVALSQRDATGHLDPLIPVEIFNVRYDEKLRLASVGSQAQQQPVLRSSNDPHVGPVMAREARDWERSSADVPRVRFQLGSDADVEAGASYGHPDGDGNLRKGNRIISPWKPDGDRKNQKEREGNIEAGKKRPFAGQCTGEWPLEGLGATKPTSVGRGDEQQRDTKTAEIGCQCVAGGQPNATRPESRAAARGGGESDRELRDDSSIGSMCPGAPTATRDQSGVFGSPSVPRGGDAFMCSCHYESADLEEINKFNWDNPIMISGAKNSFPIKIRINGHKMIGFIDEYADFSVIAPQPWFSKERVQIMTGKVTYEGTIVPLMGILSATLKVSEKVGTSVPVMVAKLPPGIDLVLGRNFVNKLNGFYNKFISAYSFHCLDDKVDKYRAKVESDEDWEILIVPEEKNFSKLFKINLKVDGLLLPAVLDLGAVRSIINSKYCTDKTNLNPVKLKLRTANDTYLPVRGVYRAAITIENCKVHHPLISAELPSDVAMLLGNDFLAKYDAVISWATETLQVRVGNSVVTTKRIQERDDSRKNNNCDLNIVQNLELQNNPVTLYSNEPVIIEPGHCAVVEACLSKNVLPALLSPSAVLNSFDVSTVECLLLTETSVPVFNCSEESIFIPKGTLLGMVRPENQKIELSRLTETNIAELQYAVKNKFITLESEENLPVESCNILEEGADSIPSLDGADLNEAQKEKVRLLCRHFPEVFSTEMKAGAPVPNYVAHLERTHEGTIYRRQWPLSARQKEIARTEINKFLNLGVVEDGESVVTLPFFIIEKRGSTSENPVGRCLFDSRALNKVLVRPQYRSYTIADILAYCADKTLLCTLDINHYFFNIAVTEESKLLLGFTFEGRSLRWTRLPQGLAVSPPESLMALSKIMRGLEIRYYVDDLILGGKDFESLLTLLGKLLNRLKDSNLCVDPKKAILFRKELPIVGLIVKAGEYVKPNPERFKPLLALKNPKNATQLRSVIAFFSYHRRYIRNFAVNTQKYQDMCNEKIEFEWTEKDANNIEEMYQYLLSNATLALFNEDLPTKLHCDASSKSLGAMVCQKHGERYKAVAYFSAPIKGTKLAWSAFHKECLALYESIKYFEDELRLLKKFRVVSDCTSLKYLLAMESPKAPFDKMISFLSQFCFDFEFVKSEKNKVPDALSRLDPPQYSEESIVIPDSLITPLKKGKDKPVNEIKVNVKNSKGDIVVAKRKVPVYYLDDGTEVLDIDYVESSNDPIMSFQGEFAFLSNFYPVLIPYDSILYHSVEHAYQASKTYDTARKIEISRTSDPKQAKAIGKSVMIRSDWEAAKDKVMLDLLLLKFRRGSELESKLLETGEREIIEGNYWCDMYWGTCHCNVHREYIGKNVLGKLLCIVRDFKRDCYNMEPTRDDKEQMILAVTTRSGKNAQKKENNSDQQVEENNIDQESSKRCKQPTALPNDGEPVAEASDTGEDKSKAEDEKFGEQRQQAQQPTDGEEVEEKCWNSVDLNNDCVIKSFTGNYYFLSNYAPSKFTVGGKEFLSVEDALNTNGFRFSELTYVTEQNQGTSALDKLRARLQEVTRKAAAEFLVKCLNAKFKDNFNLQRQLLDTEGKLLVYCNNSCDNFLGLCRCTKCSVGTRPLNFLGVELMKIRYKLIKERDLKRQAESSESVPVLKKLIEYQRCDVDLMKIITTFNKDGKPTKDTEKIKGRPKYALKGGLLVTNTKPPRTVLPAILLPTIFKSFHSLVGHSGRDVLSLAIKKFYYHKNIDDKISEFVNSCRLCQEYKPSKERYGLLRRRRTYEIFHSLTSDFCHISSKALFKYCLLITDNFSNFTYLYPCAKADQKCLQEGLNDFFSRFGRARYLSIDAGPQSKSKEFLEYATKEGFQIVTAASGAHLSIGRVESHVKKLISVLRFLVDNKATRLVRWHELLQVIQFHLNNCPQIATNGLSPHEIVYGKTLETPLSIKTTLPMKNSIHSRVKVLEEIRTKVKEARDKAFQRYSKYYNKNRKNIVFKKNERVFVKLERKASKANPIKFQKFYREAVIKKRVSKLIYLVTLRHKNGVLWRRHCHVSHLKKAYTRPDYLNEENAITLFVCKDGLQIPSPPMDL